MRSQGGSHLYLCRFSKVGPSSEEPSRLSIKFIDGAICSNHKRCMSQVQASHKQDPRIPVDSKPRQGPHSTGPSVSNDPRKQGSATKTLSFRATLHVEGAVVPAGST